MSEPEPAQAHSTVESLFAHGWSASLNNSNLLKFLQRKGVANLGVLALAQAATMITGLLTNVIWARYMPQETYGGFKVVFNIVNIVGSFCLLGIGQAALMSAAQRVDGNLQGLIRSKLLANVGGSALILIASAYYAFGKQSSPSIAQALVVAAILFPVYNISDIWMAWLNGRSSFAKLTRGRVLASAILMLVLASASFVGVIKLWVVLLVYFVLSGIQNALMLIQIYSARENDRSDPNILSFGRHSSIAMMFGGLIGLDVVILNHRFSAKEVAIYAVAQVFPDLMKSLFSVFNQLFSATINSGQSIPDFWQSFRYKFLFTTLLFSVVGLSGFWLIPMATEFLFTDIYARAGGASCWLLMVTAIFGSTTFLGSALIATKRLVFVYVSYVGYPLVVLILYLAFCNFGLEGMIGARILATVLLSIFYSSGFYWALRSSHV